MPQNTPGIQVQCSIGGYSTKHACVLVYEIVSVYKSFKLQQGSVSEQLSQLPAEQTGNDAICLTTNIRTSLQIQHVLSPSKNVILSKTCSFLLLIFRDQNNGGSLITFIQYVVHSHLSATQPEDFITNTYLSVF